MDKSNCILIQRPWRNIKHNIAIKINNVEIKEKEYKKYSTIKYDEFITLNMLNLRLAKA